MVTRPCRGHRLAGRLIRERFSKIFVSDLGRVVETFAPLLEAGWSCELTPEIREKAGGVFEGRPCPSRYALQTSGLAEPNMGTLLNMVEQEWGTNKYQQIFGHVGKIV